MSENCTHDCSSCGVDCPSRQEPESLLEKLNDLSQVKKVIGVVSGKGGRHSRSQHQPSNRQYTAAF